MIQHHSHKGINKSHPISTEHKDHVTQLHHDDEIHKLKRIITIPKLKQLFMDNHWNTADEHFRIYYKVCKFIEENYIEK